MTMKKTLFFLIGLLFTQATFGQVNLFFEAPQNNASTTQVRAPNGQSTAAYMRACALVLQNELANIPANTNITSFGFTLSTSGSVSTPVAGNFTVYLQNTTDVSYLKGTTWSTILTGMTVCYANVLTIPLSSASTSVVVTLSTPFNYSGGGIYVAYDWFSTGPFSTTPATYLSESAILNPGCASGASSTSGPTTLGTTNFRPSFLFGFQNPYSNDARISGIEASGRIAGALGLPQTVRAVVQNQSNTTLTNLTASLSVTGANPFISTQTIPSLAPGASTLISFTPFTPLNPGTQTAVVSVPADQVNSNNSASFLQEVTCDIWGQNPATNTFTSNSVGFGTGSGILAANYLSPATNTIIGIRGAISTNSAAVGNSVYGVLLSSTGAILATSNTVVISTAMLGNFVNFNFTSGVVTAPATNYLLGFAQTLPFNAVAYYPAGTTASAYLPQNLYYTAPLLGGAPAVLGQNFGYFGIEAVFAHSVTVSPTSPTVSCGTPTVITALSTTNYSWSTGSTASSITINNPTTTTLYTVTATNTLGCIASRVATLNVTPLAISATLSPSLVCSGNPISLSASGAASFTWSSGTATTNLSTYTDSPLSTSGYTLAGSNPNGCFASTVIVVPVNPLPIVNLSASVPSVCVGTSLTLQGSGTASSYSWSSGQTTGSISVAPAATSVFTLSGFSTVGCEKTATILVTVGSFTPGITSSTAICDGNSIQLQTTGASTLQWSTGSIFSSITVTPNVTTTYSVTGKGPNNCQGTNQTTITVNPTPTVQASASRSVICRGESAILTASGAASYVWNTGATTTSISLSPTTTAQQIFTVTGTNAAGCTATAQVSLKANTCQGLEEQTSGSDIQIFPNPGNGLYQLKLNGRFENGTVSASNILGKIIYQSAIHGTDCEVNLSHFPNGYYIIQVTTNDGEIVSKKVLKQ